MSCGDVRGLLQYVPQFRGKVFVIVVDTPVFRLAETMLDLVALQDIGVQLVIGSTVHHTDDLLDRAAEVEMKFYQQVTGVSSDPEQTLAALKRGQAAVIDLPSSDPLSADLSAFAHTLAAVKIVLLHGAEQKFPRGAFRAADVTADQPHLLQSAATVCNAGIPRVHVLDGTDPAVLLSELFSNEGAGTMVYADSYRVIRPLREDDIVELLGMIGRSVRNAHLVPRDYVEIEQNISDYLAMDIDGNVVGSVALIRYEGSDTAEIGCLYVKQSHEGLGYALELVKHAEQRARDLNLNSVFALTNRAAEFFQKQLSFKELSADQIPEQRHQELLASGRDSRVFGKNLKG